MWYRNSTPACAPKKIESGTQITVCQFCSTLIHSSQVVEKNLSIRKEKTVHVCCICVRETEREGEKEREILF